MARLSACTTISVSSASQHNKYLRLANSYNALIVRLEFLLDHPDTACSVPIISGHPMLLVANSMWKSLILLLDIYNTSRLKSYIMAQREFAVMPTYVDFIESWGFEKSISHSTVYDEYLKMTMKRKRKREFIACNLLEATEASRIGWFTVFDTLTVDPVKAYSEDLTVEQYLFRGRKMEQYFKSIQRSILTRLYPDKSVKELTAYVKLHNISVRDYFRYALVFEPHKNGAPHAHILMHMKVLPNDCSLFCPNKGKPKKDNRQIRGFKDFWAHGYSNPIAVRYNMQDSYAGLGWSWPIDKQGKPLLQSDPKQIAFYLAKYMAKERTNWKIRHSQLFGISVLTKKMQRLTLKNLKLCLSWRKLLITHYGVALPQSLLRKSAVRLMVKNYLTFEQIFDHVTTWRCRRQLHLRSKTWIPMTQEFSQLNSSTIMIPSMTGTAISDHLQPYFGV